MRYALIALAACSSGLPAARYANTPIVVTMDDRHDVPTTPETRDFLPNLYFFDQSLHSPVDHALALERPRHAMGVNALDEVPDSTWFQNRNAQTRLTAEQVGTGPVTHDPGANLPWTIESSKTGGSTRGFIVKDNSGVKYLLKFDALGDPPELETATHVICNRLMWAAGWNVAEDQILYVKRTDLVIGKDAKKKNLDGKTLGHLTEKDVDDVMKGVRAEKDGRLRVLASRWIDGTTVGGFPSTGTRDDDPNDTIPHEHRRDLRGMATVDAWLDAVDVTEGQFVDAWVEDHGHHYLRHYAVDFGKSMGAMGIIDHDWWRGHAYRVDIPDILHHTILLGLDDRWWEHRSGPADLVGVSPLFDATSFDPAHWYPDTPGFLSFRIADRFDQFWGAELVGSFTRDQLRAAVDAGKLTDPRSVTYLVDTLEKRQRMVLAHWFAQVPPIVKPAYEQDLLCFDDLAIERQLVSTTKYIIEPFDFDGRPLAATAIRATSSHTCAVVPFAPWLGNYTIFRVTIDRPEYAGSVYIHAARSPAGAMRVIGLWRE
ncbi:MAG: hypothetical protein QM831_28770 [Kofleriaceae bacterium]